VVPYDIVRYPTPSFAKKERIKIFFLRKKMLFGNGKHQKAGGATDINVMTLSHTLQQYLCAIVQ
jgi:hypothetical protein